MKLVKKKGGGKLSIQIILTHFFKKKGKSHHSKHHCQWSLVIQPA